MMLWADTTIINVFVNIKIGVEAYECQYSRS